MSINVSEHKKIFDRQVGRTLYDYGTPKNKLWNDDVMKGYNDRMKEKERLK